MQNLTVVVGQANETVEQTGLNFMLIVEVIADTSELLNDITTVAIEEQEMVCML